MGVCISKESVLVNEQSTIESDTCIKIDNKSFDLFVFTKSTDLNKHKRIQANLTQI